MVECFFVDQNNDKAIMDFMKTALKFIVVAVVILGLVGSFVLTGITRQSSNYQAPSGQPSTAGPTEAPPR